MNRQQKFDDNEDGDLDEKEECQDICSDENESDRRISNVQDCYNVTPKQQNYLEKYQYDKDTVTCYNFDPMDELRRTLPVIELGSEEDQEVFEFPRNITYDQYLQIASEHSMPKRQSLIAQSVKRQL